MKSVWYPFLFSLSEQTDTQVLFTGLMFQSRRKQSGSSGARGELRDSSTIPMTPRGAHSTLSPYYI